MRSSGVLALVVCLVAGIGCEKVGFGGHPIAYPSSIYAGETFAIAIGGTPPAPEQLRSFDASAENILIRLQEISTGVIYDFAPRTVVSSM